MLALLMLGRVVVKMRCNGPVGPYASCSFWRFGFRFFYRFRVSFVTGHRVDFVQLDLSG
jgi:hypothetical protein